MSDELPLNPRDKEKDPFAGIKKADEKAAQTSENTRGRLGRTVRNSTARHVDLNPTEGKKSRRGKKKGNPKS
ncbi:MAG TPA: hypothetical protein VK497_02790 [Candidatus Saccharimonadales bacterium]|nr:hypothetical protein [Candidatus Saccharimonadales bacterium]